MVRQALFKTLKKFKIKGNHLSRVTGITEAQLSRFRNGGELSLMNFEKIVAALPPEAYQYFWSQLAIDGMDTVQIGQILTAIGDKLKQNNLSLDQSQALVETR